MAAESAMWRCAADEEKKAERPFMRSSPPNFEAKFHSEELATAFNLSPEFRVKSAFLERCSLIWHETSVAAPMQSSLPKDRCCSRR